MTTETSSSGSLVVKNKCIFLVIDFVTNISCTENL